MKSRFRSFFVLLTLSWIATALLLGVDHYFSGQAPAWSIEIREAYRGVAWLQLLILIPIFLCLFVCLEILRRKKLSDC